METTKPIARTHGLLFRTVSVVMLLFFLMSIAVQYNDPDGIVWMLLYGAIWVATLYHLLRPATNLRLTLLFLVLLYAAGVIFLSGSFGDTSLDAFKAVGMKNIIQEQVRELWGLVICLVWTLVLLMRNGLKPATQ